VLRLLVQPRAARDQLVGVQGDAFKVRIAAPPVDGKANAHLVQFLAGQFGVHRSDVMLIGGGNARRKTVLIHRPQQLIAGIS
jgi:uncharacterized protein (TIGR00251 family)